MQTQTAVVIGASGMIGELVTNLLLEDATFSKVKLMVRKMLPLQHVKLEQSLVNFTDQGDFKNKLGNGDCIFSCIGTTMSNVKSDKNLYRQIDHDIPAHASQFGKTAGFKSFLMVSSVGANENSSNFYLKLKGETERDVMASSIQNICIFRPSMILGKRKENRPVEKIMQPVSKVFSALLFGGMRKYKAIEATAIAKAMVQQAKEQTAGTYILEYDDIMNAANAYSNK